MRGQIISARALHHYLPTDKPLGHSITVFLLVHRQGRGKIVDTGAGGENLVWDGVCVCVLFFCVWREQLFVKGEMGSIRGPDGIQLRQIK